MKSKFYLLILVFLTNMSVFAQCPDGVAINNISQPTCGSSNGSFTVEVNPAQSPALYESSIDGGGTWFQHTSGNAQKGYTNKPPGLYKVQVRMIGTTTLCTSRDFILRADYISGFTAVPTSATACNNANGSILLGGGISATDSVSWISALNPVFSVVSSLAAQKITNLKPGIYYVIIKNPSNNYCYTTKLVTVGNSGTACPAASFCANAQGTNNFPNGTFGAGTSKNAPQLPAGQTAYGYSQLASSGPDDGFYAIANTTDYNSAGGKVFNQWTITTDHTGNPNGYMMVVNASYDRDVVIEKSIDNLCPGKRYQFSAYLRNIFPVAALKPNLTFLIDGVGLYTTGDISSSDWFQIGFTFLATTASAKFSLRNNNGGGSGNDWAIDDIYVGTCVPTVTLNPIISDCQSLVNPPTQATATITDVSTLYDTYQWQLDKQDGAGFVNQGAVQTGTFDANNKYTATITLPNPINPIINNGWTYRIIAGTGPDDLGACSYISTQRLILQDCNVVLPVKLVAVTGVLNNSKSLVSWQVADQLNINHYELEKSIDGKIFAKVTDIATQAGITANYVAEDASISGAINYYRIKVVDNDGNFSYSQIVTLAVKGNTDAIKIFPNPVMDDLFILIPNTTKISTAIVMDLSGRVIAQKNIGSSATNVYDMKLPDLPAGFYTIKLISIKGDATTLPFIKK